MSHKFSGFFLPKLKKESKSKIVFYIVAFDPIEIQTRLAPQKDHQHLNFLKDNYVVGKKMNSNGFKIAKVKGCLFYIEMEYSLTKESLLINMKQLQFDLNAYNQSQILKSIYYILKQLHIYCTCTKAKFLPSYKLKQASHDHTFGAQCYTANRISFFFLSNW